jgi:hypothetical protein
LDKLLIKIRDKDDSHITLKLKQCVNFLKFYTKINTYFTPIKSTENDLLKDSFEIEISKYAELINEICKEKEKFQQFLLPSFFNYDLIFEDGSTFNQLSSGEKQMVYSTTTVTYHLLNLESVFKNNDKDLKKYQYVNLIYDEIELYHHPEFQRKFLKYIIGEIKKLNLKKIKSINILFITHSPFILSDIPKQNVLFLEVDEKTKKAKPIEYKGDNTFGANIHQMLMDGFFISDTKGAFVTSKIKEFLEFYNNRFSKTKQDFEFQLSFFENLINLIGEDYVRRILTNHLNDLKRYFEIEKYEKIDLDNLEAEKKRLEERINRIKGIK